MLERITASEEALRDRTVGKVVAWLIPQWIRPNHITCLRALLVGIAIVLYLEGWPLEIQTNVLVVAALTDTVDGVLARTRGQTSALGRQLDELSDWLLGAWMGLLTLLNGLLNTSLIIMMVAPQLVLGVTGRVEAVRIGNDGVSVDVDRPGTRPNTVARLQFVAVLVGFTALLRSRGGKITSLRKLGLACLYLEASLAWLLAAYRMAKTRRSQVGREYTSSCN